MQAKELPISVLSNFYSGQVETSEQDLMAAIEKISNDSSFWLTPKIVERLTIALIKQRYLGAINKLFSADLRLSKKKWRLPSVVSQLLSAQEKSILLHLALLNKNPKLADLLIVAGAHVNLQYFYVTPLMQAIVLNNAELVEKLIEFGAEVNMQVHGVSALISAAFLKYRQLNDTLILKGPSANLENYNDYTDSIIEAGVAEKSQGLTALMYAVLLGYSKITAILLSKGADTNFRNCNGHTSSMMAIMIGHTDVALMCLSAENTNIQMTDYSASNTALMLAIKNNNIPIIQYLLKKDSSIVFTRLRRDWNALMEASFLGNLEAACLLIAEYEKFAESCSSRVAPSRLVTENKKTQAVSLKMTEKLDEASDTGLTPLIIAAKMGHEAIVKLLIEKGASLDIFENRWDVTALMIAIHVSKPHIATMLINAGASIRIKSKSGATALSWAKKYCREIIPLIKAKERGLLLTSAPITQKPDLTSVSDYRQSNAVEKYQKSSKGLITKETIKKILTFAESGNSPTPENVYLEDFDYSSVGFDDIYQLSQRWEIIANRLFFGIHQKYSKIDTAAPIPRNLLQIDATLRESVGKNISYQQASFFTMSSLSRHSSSCLEQFYTAESKEYRIYSGQVIDNKLPAIVIFAGRGSNALLPPPNDACVFIILTDYQYTTECADYKNTLLALGYHIVVLSAPCGVSSSTGAIEIQQENYSEAGKIIARRRSGLLLSYDFGFETLVMMDDNIESISFQVTAQSIESDNSWKVILYSLLMSASQTTAVITTVPTCNPLKQPSSSDQIRMGWKVLIFNMPLLANLFTREQSYFLFPCDLSASSEDAFIQLIVHIAAQRASHPLLGFTLLSEDICFIKRSRSSSSKNICAKSGVFAQRIILKPHEEAAALSYLGESKFESLRIGMLIFNNNISVNEKTRLASNRHRIEYDIAASIGKKRKQHDPGKQGNFSIAKEVTSFEGALLEIAQANILSLRAPQASCLQILAEQPASHASIFVSSLPTGAGKTRIQAYLAYAMSHIFPQTHTIIVAPTRTLSEQLDADFYNEGLSLESEYRQRLIAVYSSNSAPASSLSFLLQNEKIKTSASGNIFVFCLRSFNNLIKFALDKTVNYNHSALTLLSRLKMIIFDEEHLTFSEEVSEKLDLLALNGGLPALSRIFGFSATTPANPIYANTSTSKLKTQTIPRVLTFSYSAQEAQDAGFIRPISYQVAQSHSICEFFKNYTFTDGTPLINHVGVIICKSIQQLEEMVHEVLAEFPSLSVYEIHSKHRNCVQNIAKFSQHTTSAVALVIDMLREGYNNPEVRYTISLKENLSPTSKEQRAGRSRRKNGPYDNYTALFVELSFTKKRQLCAETASDTEAEVRSPKRKSWQT